MDGFLLIAWRLSLAQSTLQGEEFLLHAPHLAKWFMWGVSLTHSCCLMWGVSLKHPLLFYVVRILYMPHALFWFFLLLLLFLHGPCCFMCGIALTHSVLFYMEGFSYISGDFFDAGSLFSMPCSISYQEFVLHTLCKFMCGDFLIVCPVFFRVKRFFYVPYAVLCGKFLLQIYVPCISLSGEFLLHTPC